MAQVALAKGIAVPSDHFLNFTKANNIRPLECTTLPFDWQDIELLDKFFQSRNMGGDVKVFVPQISGLTPPTLFICYDWVFVLVAREVSNALQKPMPPGFPALCQDLGIKAEPSTFVIFTQGWTFKWVEKDMDVLAKGDLEYDHDGSHSQ